MEIIEYPFIKAGGAGSRPILFIRLSCPSTGRFQDTMALVDTGARQCCVPANFAETLGLDLSSGQKRIVRTASSIADAHEHGCGIKIWNTHEFFKNNKVVVHDVPNIPVYFVTGLKDILLGVSFLNEYVLTIDYHRKVFSLCDA